jgi:glycosidase
VNRVQLNPLDSHDTPRFLTSTGGDLPSLKLAQSFLFSFPGTPCLFYGDETGLEGGNDPDCRRSFSWAEQDWNHDILEFTKNLVALRHKRRDWRWGSFRRLHAAAQVYAYERRLDPQRSVTVLNASDGIREIALETGIEDGGTGHVIAGQAEILATNPLLVRLPPRTAAVVDLGAGATGT